MSESDDSILELKRAPGICCPEPTCDYTRPEYKACEGCGKQCRTCRMYPLAGMTEEQKDILWELYLKYEKAYDKFKKAGN